jgi:hypothetical protein
MAVAGVGLWACLTTAAALTVIRLIANMTRWLSARWCGVSIAGPYLERPAVQGIRQRLTRLRADPAVRRDLL